MAPIAGAAAIWTTYSKKKKKSSKSLMRADQKIQPTQHTFHMFINWKCLLSDLKPEKYDQMFHTLYCSLQKLVMNMRIFLMVWWKTRCDTVVTYAFQFTLNIFDYNSINYGKKHSILIHCFLLFSYFLTRQSVEVFKNIFPKSSQGLTSIH